VGVPVGVVVAVFVGVLVEVLVGVCVKVAVGITLKKTSSYPPASGVTKSAAEENTIYCPSSEMLGLKLPEVPSAPSDAVLISRITPVSRSFTKISGRSFSSFGTRLVASDLNTTNLPSGVTEGSKLAPSANTPRFDVLTMRACPVVRSLRKISARLLVSPTTRFDASDSNTT
jgi:hypothetical protein